MVGRPILYKTSKEFLLRFGLKDVGELPSLEEFEKLASEGQEELFPAASPPEAPRSAVEEPIADSREPAEDVQAEAQSEPSEVPTTHKSQS